MYKLCGDRVRTIMDVNYAWNDTKFLLFFLSSPFFIPLNKTYSSLKIVYLKILIDSDSDIAISIMNWLQFAYPYLCHDLQINTNNKFCHQSLISLLCQAKFHLWPPYLA